MIITKELADKVSSIVAQGLCKGVGRPIPGSMCVEAAVCYALGEPHGDNPSCVGAVVRAYKIALNDSNWSSNEARAIGMKQLAIAQLGSDVIDQQHFTNVLVGLTIKRLIPTLFREIANGNQAMLDVADRCEREGTVGAAAWAARAAQAAEAAWAAWAARAAEAAWAAEDARAAARAAEAARAAALAAEAAALAAEAAGNDKYLILSAELGVEALRQAGSPGVQFL